MELMKAAVARTHGPHVVGGVGGFAGLYDLSQAREFRRPLLATSTDGVGTKVAIAAALDKHDGIGQDLVGMVVDDIVVVGATPLFMTDYIACGRVVPERIALIVRGIADACLATGTALIGGETAEHPGLLGPDEYDLAGAAVGLVEADRVLGANTVRDGDLVLAIASSGPHANGYSLIRHALSTREIRYDDHADALGCSWGEALLTPTRLYAGALVELLSSPLGEAVHGLSHVTGGGIAANLARVLPADAWVDVDRGTWSPPVIFRELCAVGQMPLSAVEGTWNLGVGMIAVVAHHAASSIAARLAELGHQAWVAGRVSIGGRPDGDFVQGAKGVNGGAVRLVGDFSA